MNKEQTARMIQLEERNAALAEEVQALEFEVKKLINENKFLWSSTKEKGKDLAQATAELSAMRGSENLFKQDIEELKAELQRYKDPVMEAAASIRNGQVELNRSICNAMRSGKYYRLLVIEKEKEGG